MKNFLKLALLPIGMIAFQSCDTYKSATTAEKTMTAFANTKWTLKTLNGKSVGDKYASLTLDAKKENSAIIKAPCNGYFGGYTLDPKKSTITFEGLAGTMKMCAEDGAMQVENDMIKALSDKTLTYNVTGNSLTFLNTKKEQVMVFEYKTSTDQIAYLLKHNWKLIQMNHEGQAYEQTISFTKESNNKYKANGFSGCNNYFGNVVFKGDNIQFSNVGVTRRACMEADISKQESDFLSILNTPSLTFDIADQVLNIYKGEQLVMMFGRDDSKK